jgi:hypothetical protein
MSALRNLAVREVLGMVRYGAQTGRIAELFFIRSVDRRLGRGDRWRGRILTRHLNLLRS